MADPATDDFLTQRQPVPFTDAPRPQMSQPQTPSPEAAPPASPTMSQAEIDKFVAQRQGITDTAVSNIQSLDQLRGRIAFQPTPHPALPKYQDIPKAPQPQFHDVFKDSSPGLIFATVLGSLMSRRAGMGAMTAATGYLEGFQKGDKEKMENERKNWEDHVAEIVKQNNVEKERYDAVWNDTKLSQADKAAQLAAIGASIGDQQTMAAIKDGNLDFQYKLYNDRDKAALSIQLAKIKSSMSNPQRIALDRFMQERPDASAKEIQQFLQQLRPERSAPGIQLRQFLNENPNASADDIMNFRAETAGRMAESRARMSAEARADASTLTRLTQSQSAIRSFENTALRNGEMLVELAKKVDRTGIPVVERWTRAGRKAILGDPDVTRFDAQVQLYRAEVAKILTNPNLTGVLTDTARREVEGFISGGSTAKQIAAVTQLLKRDFKNRDEAIEKERDVVIGRLHGEKSSEPKGDAGSSDASSMSDDDLKKKLGIQ